MPEQILDRPFAGPEQVLAYLSRYTAPAPAPADPKPAPSEPQRRCPFCGVLTLVLVAAVPPVWPRGFDDSS